MHHHARRFLLAAACAGLLPLCAAAAEAPAVAIDRELAALKAEAVELGRDLEAAERAVHYPGGTQASVYVAVRVPGFLLESVSVSLDGSPPQRHSYDGSEALALLKDGGWHRLARESLAPGAHRLQARFSGRFHDARSDAPPVTGEVEAAFEKGPGELDLVLPIARTAKRDPAGPASVPELGGLRISRIAVLAPPERVELGREAAGGRDDPRHRAALFLRDGHRYFSALVELGDLQRAAVLPASLRLLLAECYAGFGMDTQAGAIYRELAAGQHDAAVLARAQLQLAQFDYQRGRPEQAIERLAPLRAGLPGALRNEWRVLMTSSLLAQERDADAVALLDAEGAGSATPAVRYNRAVALIRSGKVAEGRELLEAVGTMAVGNTEQLALRDKANVTLGYQHLQEQRGAAARRAFSRVRTHGPFSNRALLGLGWSEVAQEPAAAPGDAPAAVTDEGSLGTLLDATAPASGQRLEIEGAAAAPSTLAPAEQDALRRALAAWVELVKRDPMDPAVQEGLLAIPWALDRLQAHAQSLTRYLNAIAALETARTRMQEAIASIRRGALVNDLLQDEPDSERGWLWKVRTLRNRPETYFLQSLLAEHRFQEPLKRLRDARMLGARLDAWRPRLAALDAGTAGALRARLDALRPRFAAVAARDDTLRAISLKELEGQRATIERYLTEARFAVARIYDRQHVQGAP